ncbi:hypothetical protein ACI3K5_07185 [Streptomyces sp. MPA0124]|nr:hypothetical protein [Streptomyces sp. CCM_MD2014]
MPTSPSRRGTVSDLSQPGLLQVQDLLDVTQLSFVVADAWPTQ